MPPATAAKRGINGALVDDHYRDLVLPRVRRSHDSKPDEPHRRVDQHNWTEDMRKTRSTVMHFARLNATPPTPPSPPPTNLAPPPPPPHPAHTPPGST